MHVALCRHNPSRLGNSRATAAIMRTRAIGAAARPSWTLVAVLLMAGGVVVACAPGVSDSPATKRPPSKRRMRQRVPEMTRGGEV